MKIVIIEDEPLTAEELADIIGSIQADITVVAILYSVQAAMVFFDTKPVVDLVFSDIQLGDGLSFEIFKTVEIGCPIIFCTAYDEYALDAIKSNAIEYVLKPFTKATVTKANER